MGDIRTFNGFVRKKQYISIFAFNINNKQFYYVKNKF